MFANNMFPSCFCLSWYQFASTRLIQETLGGPVINENREVVGACPKSFEPLKYEGSIASSVHNHFE